MLNFIIAIAGILLLLALYLIFKAALSRNITKEAFVETPGNETIQELNQNFVWIKFHHKGKNLALKYYYDAAVFKDPYDFYTVNKIVTVRFEDKNPENFIIIQDKKGGNSRLMAAGLIGGTIGLAAAGNEVTWDEKIKKFLIVGGICFAISYLIIWITPFFDFLNYFKKNEE